MACLSSRPPGVRSSGLALAFSLTFEPRLPDGVGVAEAGDDVVADGEGELEPVRGAFLEGEPHALAVGLHRQRQHHVGPPGRQDGQAHYLHVRLQRLCEHHTHTRTGCSNFRSASYIALNWTGSLN
jgi:hypothetical protein